MDSSRNVANRDSVKNWLLKLVLAIGLSLGIALFVGATAWAGYSRAEIEAVESDDERKVRAIRVQEIKQLNIALGRRLPANRRADLYLRLAELHLEAYRAQFLLEGRVHEKRLEAGTALKTIDRSTSIPELKAGIAACEQILKLKIPYDKMDQVYWFLGFNNGELGNTKESLRYFELLIQKSPKSPFASEAYRSMGDAAFAKNDFRKALGYYEQAVRTTEDQDRIPRLQHKLAWAYYRTKQYDRAVQAMKDAIARSSRNEEKFLSLKEEALRDLAIFMTETGKVDEAIEYFRKVAGDKDYYPKALERLGKQYERNVEPLKAIQVYESLLKTNPTDEAAFRVRAKLVDLDLRRMKYDQALSRLKGITVPKGGESETVTAVLNLKSMSRRTATDHHVAFRKEKSKQALLIAESFYSTYLDVFLSQEDSRNETPEIRMYLADVKRELGKSSEASKLYRQVVESRDKRYAKEAGALWTASLADAIKKSTQDDKDKHPREKPSPIELEFVEAADALQKSLGDTTEGREAELRAAQVLAGYRQSQKDAIARSRALVNRAPRTTQALTAARLWIQILTDRQDSGAGSSSELDDAIAELRKNDELMAADRELGGKKLAQMVSEYDRKRRVSAIASYEKDKNYAEAAKGYESFAIEATQRGMAEKAFASAVSSYVKAGDLVSAERVTAAWLKRYSDSKEAREWLRANASLALVQGQFEQSASLFEKLGRSEKDAALLETAARIYEGAGDMTRARGLWEEYSTLFPKSPRRHAILLELAKSLDTAGKDSEAAKSYNACMGGAPELEAECGARLADLYYRSKQYDSASQTYRKTAALQSKSKKKSVQSPFIAYARYRIAELMERDQRFGALPSDEKQLKNVLAQRLTFLEKLSRAYNDAVEAGGPWGVAALDRLAAWVYRFADEIDAIPAPAGADAAGTEAFKKGLAGVSGPLRQKAAQTWVEAYKKAEAQEILSPAIPRIVDQLSSAGVSVSRAQGARGRFRLAGMPADGGREGREHATKLVQEKLSQNIKDADAWVDYGNLLWGSGKPLLAKTAYERALSLNSKNAAALNNRAVIALSGSGEEDWFSVIEANLLFKQALAQDEFFLIAKLNRAQLLNYYRLFSIAKPLWEQILVKSSSADAHDGLAVAHFGTGAANAAEAAFEKATNAGASKCRFVLVFHEAVREASDKKDPAKKCLSRLDDLDEKDLAGFEREAYNHLKRTCQSWKTGK